MINNLRGLRSVLQWKRSRTSWGPDTTVICGEKPEAHMKIAQTGAFGYTEPMGELRLTEGNMAMATINKDLKSRWDYAAYTAIPADGKRHEIINGVHFVNPAPNLYHQEVSRHIQFQLYSQIELAGLGKVINAPVDLQLSDHDIVQPDLVIVTQGRKHILTPTKIKGVPDLVIEIVSPTNPDHDLKTKRKLYEDSAIPEYWIVLPDEHQVLQLVLHEGRYQESLETSSITMKTAPHATVKLQQVW